ncbi:MAG: T9SS type A sorting domain-containing protein [Ignavibacteria bacterium]|nr:T9SS type A sorting domain-containing protein [Ignavibacteria bacterium]
MRDSFFLSKIFRNIICFVFFTAIITPISGQFIDAYINDFKVNDDITTRTQSSAKIGVDSSGNFVVAWNDRRSSIANNSSQIYCQIFDKDGNGMGNNFRIGHDTSGIFGLSVLKDGKFICFWVSIFNGGFDAELYYQRFDKIGNELSKPIRVVDSTFSSLALISGDIESDSNGNFVLTWNRIPYAATYNLVFCQRYDSAGNRLGGSTVVNEIQNGAGNQRIAINNDMSFVITWQDDRRYPGNKFDIFFQRFNTSGIKIGNNIRVNDDNDSTKDQNNPTISSNYNGTFVISWTDYRSLFSTGDIYFQCYDSNAATLGTNTKANINTGNIGISVTAMRFDKKFIIAWTDDSYAGRFQFYGRRFNEIGNPIGSPYMFPVSSPAGSIQSGTDIMILEDRVYSVWENTISSNGDIFCNVRGFQNPDTTIISVINNQNIITEYKLFAPFPNPFNPITKIRYKLSEKTYTTISIYDITGKFIYKLTGKVQSAGNYEIKFDGTKLSTGIYFIKLNTETGYKEIQKLVLLK